MKNENKTKKIKTKETKSKEKILNTLSKKIEKEVRTMFSMQERLNSLTSSEWRSANYDWQLYIMVELGELMDHFGYKHWKGQHTDLEQCQLEVIDVFHFWISHTLIKGHESDIMRFVYYFSDKNRQKVVNMSDSVAVRTKIRKMIANSANNFFTTDDMCHLIDMFISFDEVYKLYFAKNTLNIFRQENGYKEKTYIKIWNGQEDNQVLMDIINESGYDLAKVHQNLSVRYSKAKKV